MHLPSDQKQLAAQALVNVGAVRIASRQPFIYTSGWASPVYLDTRLLLSHVLARGLVMDMAAAALSPVIQAQGINTLVGAESSGIAFATLLADRLQLPLLTLRKRPKGWDVQAQLDGHLPLNARALLVDDVTTDGQSKLGACAALRQCGAVVHDAFVLVNFGIYPSSAESLAQANLSLHALLTWPELFAVCDRSAPLSPVQRQSIAEFNASPVQWSLHNGGVGA